MHDTASPKTTAIVCTRDRPHTLRRALASVVQESLSDVEIVVVDDGSDPPVALEDTDNRVRLIRIAGSGAGAARAAGVDAARGAYVAFCDDDDEWLSGHLETLVTFLDQNPDIDLVYGDAEWLVDGQAPFVPYSFDFDIHLIGDTNYIHPSDLVVRVDAVRSAGGFDPTLRSLEDWDLWIRLSVNSRLWHLPVVVTRRHWLESSVSTDPDWAPFDRISGSHRSRLARPITPFDRESWHEGRRRLLWRSILRPYEGYGVVGRALLRAVADEGVEITVVPEGNQSPAGFEQFHQPVDNWGCLAFHYTYFEPVESLACDRVVAYTMWESTEVPDETIEDLNRASTLVCVPCAQNVEMFRESGLRVPIAVLPHGVDTKRFPLIERPARETFTFGTFGDLTVRKGYDVLLKAFINEFRHEDDVRLMFKSVGFVPDLVSNDPRISMANGRADDDEIVGFLSHLDAFVLPSRGEGFGLCGIEAMATGLPTVATNWGGPADYLDPVDSLPLSCRLVRVDGAWAHQTQFFGQWAEPDVEHLQALMRWLYEHPAEAADMGRRASLRVHTEWTWQRAARRLVNLLDGVAAQ
ncbi:MAG: Family 2 glycosyl transferase [Acidimicrobiales bacterium]|jgi:glycosyltransferase involved in cell wall biosynthesis|nr:Family 2 glycosyl transferase [Acidimicrobiales bacterium]